MPTVLRTRNPQQRLLQQSGCGTSTLVLVLLSIFLHKSLWTDAFSVVPVSPATTPTRQSLRLDLSRHNADPPDNKSNTPPPSDWNCDEDGECEIDWDAMPFFEDEEEDDEDVQAVYSDDLERAQDRLHMSHARRHGPSVEQRRLHMEMQWKLTESTDECVVEKPETCGSEPCPDCHGRGWSDCRFCHGTTVLRMDKAALPDDNANNDQSLTMEGRPHPPTTMASSVVLNSSGSAAAATTATRKKFMLPSSFSSCKICQQGVEMCRTCQGTGWVAAWTQIPSQAAEAAAQDDPLRP